MMKFVIKIVSKIKNLLDSIIFSPKNQINVLKESGIKIDKNLDELNLFEDWTEDDYITDPFVLLLIELGTPYESGSYRARNVMHLDTECIYDTDNYKSVFLRLIEMTDGSVSVENIRVTMNYDTEIATIFFEHRGELKQFDLLIDNDWLDTELFVKFADVFRSDLKGLTVFGVTFGGQDMIIGVVEEKKYRNLEKIFSKYIFIY